MNSHRVIELRDEDRAAPPDPQGTVIALSELLSAHVKDVEWVRDLLARWGAAPIDVCQRAQPRLVELADQAAAIRDLVETLSRGQRDAGAFSGVYSDPRAR